MSSQVPGDGFAHDSVRAQACEGEEEGRRGSTGCFCDAAEEVSMRSLDIFTQAIQLGRLCDTEDTGAPTDETSFAGVVTHVHIEGLVEPTAPSFAVVNQEIFVPARLLAAGAGHTWLVNDGWNVERGVWSSSKELVSTPPPRPVPHHVMVRRLPPPPNPLNEHSGGGGLASVGDVMEALDEHRELLEGMAAKQGVIQAALKAQLDLLAAFRSQLAAAERAAPPAN